MSTNAIGCKKQKKKQLIRNVRAEVSITPPKHFPCAESLTSRRSHEFLWTTGIKLRGVFTSETVTHMVAQWHNRESGLIQHGLPHLINYSLKSLDFLLSFLSFDTHDLDLSATLWSLNWPFRRIGSREYGSAANTIDRTHSTVTSSIAYNNDKNQWAY